MYLGDFFSYDHCKGLEEKDYKLYILVIFFLKQVIEMRNDKGV